MPIRLELSDISGETVPQGASPGWIPAWNQAGFFEAVQPSTAPGGPHTHPISEITNLQTSLDGKEAAGAASAAQTTAVQRSNHTGTQAISTVSGLQTALDGKQPVGSYQPAGSYEVTTAKAQPNGYASLDGQGKVPSAQLPVSGGGATLRSHNLSSAYPFGGAPTTMTATVHAANLCRIFPFDLPGSMTVNRVIIRTNAVLANCLQLGIFDSAGTRLWTSGVLSTVATNWVTVSTNLPVVLPAGLYYFGTTNNNVASTTAAYAVTPAIGAAGPPRWGTVPATAGAMPASINVAAITEATGGWMSYVVLSEFTT